MLQAASLPADEGTRMKSFPVFKTVDRIVSGPGCVSMLGQEANKLGFRRVGLITDNDLAQTGMHERLVNSLANNDVDCLIFDQAELEPTSESICRSAAWAKANAVDALLGFGGGSSMDTAKATAVLAVHPEPLSRYYGLQRVPGPCLPVILVPTTAGTGSEMTSNAVVSDPETDTKQGIVSDYLYARLVLLDPELTLGLPPFLTAITGIDALVHAIESYVSVNATFITDALNEKAIRMLHSNIREAYADGENMEARSQMLYGAAASGIAFSNTQNGVIHALGMSISHRHHLPHGLLMAVCAPAGMAFNALAVPAKFAFIANIFGSSPRDATIYGKARSAADGFSALLNDLEIETSLEKLGIARDELSKVASKASEYKRLMDSNPRKATVEQLKRLLEQFY